MTSRDKPSNVPAPIRVQWEDFDQRDDDCLSWNCHLDVTTGHLVDEPGDDTLPLADSPYPGQHDAMRGLRHRRWLASSVADRELGDRLLRILDDFDSADHALATQQYLEKVSNPRRRSRIEDLVTRFRRQPAERAATLLVEPHWERDTTEMATVRRHIFDRFLRQTAPAAHDAFWRGCEIRRSDLWESIQRLPVAIANEPPWLSAVTRWRDVEAEWIERHVKGLLQRLGAHVARQCPEVELGPPATKAALDACAAALGRALPPSFEQLLRWHDGSSDTIMPVGFGYRLYSATESVKKRAAHESLRDADAWYGWRPGWLPILSDPSDNHLLLDLEGAITGVRGQILSAWHDDSEWSVLSFDLAGWLETLVTLFESEALSEPDSDVSYLEWNEVNRRLFGFSQIYFDKQAD